MFRRNSEIALEIIDNTSSSTPIEYYEIRGNEVIPISPQWLDNSEHRFFPVQAIGEPNDNNAISFTIYCDQQEFSAWDYGDEVFNETARFILSRRRNGERYPCYITDLDLSRCQSNANQSIHHLHYKQWLETRLNESLQRI
jgi:adenylate cyclase class 1